MALVERLDLVWYRAADWAAERTFYTTVLGLTPVSDDETNEWLEFAPGGPVRLGLSGSGPEDLHGGAVPVFYVQNLTATLDTLVGQGIVCLEPTLEPDGSQRATVYDPTGNRLQLWEPAPEVASQVAPGDWDNLAPAPSPGDGLVIRIDFVWYMTVYPEWEQARRFFAETLGLTQTLVSADPHFAMFHTGTPVHLVLDSPEGDQLGPSGACVVVLQVRDMDEAVSRLRHHRVEHTEESGDPGGRLVSFYDPDGNQLQLHWTRPEA